MFFIITCCLMLKQLIYILLFRRLSNDILVNYYRIIVLSYLYLCIRGWILIGWILNRVDFDRVDFDRVDFDRGLILNVSRIQ